MGDPAFEALYDTAACGLLVTRGDGRILRANSTFARLVGREEADLRARTLQSLFTVGGRMFHQTHWAPLLQIQGSVAEVKLELLHADGRKLPVVLNAVRREAGGEVLHDIAVFLAQDRHRYEHELLLARRRAEDLLAKEQAVQRELIEAKAELDRQRSLAQDRALFAEQMMAIVSHDLRNPLSVIRMNAFLIGRGTLDASQSVALERVARSNDRATRLISDLLDFSLGRVGAGLKVEREDIDVHALVAEAVEDLRVAHPGREIVLRRSGAGSVSASSDRMVQVIGNLVANAITYGADRPVTLTSAVVDGSFSVSVHNEGTAISPDLLPRLFDPMTRGAAAPSADHSVGMGLYIVRAIARAHGGEVEVASDPVAGTTFTVTIPREAD